MLASLRKHTDNLPAPNTTRAFGRQGSYVYQVKVRTPAYTHQRNIGMTAQSESKRLLLAGEVNLGLAGLACIYWEKRAGVCKVMTSSHVVVPYAPMAISRQRLPDEF